MPKFITTSIDALPLVGGNSADYLPLGAGLQGNSWYLPKWHYFVDFARTLVWYPSSGSFSVPTAYPTEVPSGSTYIYIQGYADSYMANSGSYTVTYSADQAISVQGDLAASGLVDHGDGTATLTFTGSGNFRIRVKLPGNVSGALSNLQLQILANWTFSNGLTSQQCLDAGIRWNPDFTRRFTYKGKRFFFIRTMNPMNVNSDVAFKTSADVPALTDSNWVTGMPPEIVAELANTCHPVRIWHNMPMRSDSSYNQAYFTILNAQITNDTIVHLEYSNETFNTLRGNANNHIGDAIRYVCENSVSSPDFHIYTATGCVYDKTNHTLTLTSTEMSNLNAAFGGNASGAISALKDTASRWYKNRPSSVGPQIIGNVIYMDQSTNIADSGTYNMCFSDYGCSEGYYALRVEMLRQDAEAVWGVGSTKFETGICSQAGDSSKITRFFNNTSGFGIPDPKTRHNYVSVATYLGKNTSGYPITQDIAVKYYTGDVAGALTDLHEQVMGTNGSIAKRKSETIACHNAFRANVSWPFFPYEGGFGMMDANIPKSDKWTITDNPATGAAWTNDEIAAVMAAYRQDNTKMLEATKAMFAIHKTYCNCITHFQLENPNSYAFGIWGMENDMDGSKDSWGRWWLDVADAFSLADFTG